MLPRLWGNDTIRPKKNGTLADNGTGKFSDIDTKTLQYLKWLGCSHVWYTGVIRHSTQAVENGCVPSNSQFVKGKAGSPYAICDYYDVNPYLADNPDKRMEEFEDLVRRTHEAGLKLIIDFVPNHVSRDYGKTVCTEGHPVLGRDDDKTVHWKPENDFYGNIKRANKWAYDDMANQFGKPVDRTRWGMTPPTVNAYYSPVNNEIAFPAGIMQFPFFAFTADDAINYGGIGAVIGHEMIHGFDDSGRQYAADGNLKDWWTEEDASQFKELAEKVVQQYNAYTVLDTIHVNGKLTLGENLADLGGLAVAYAAFKKTPQGQSDELIDGFTPDQRFFLSWAQVWRMNVRPETAAQLILTDPHSPGDARTIGPLVNMDEWYEAFDVEEGDKLFIPEKDRVRIW